MAAGEVVVAAAGASSRMGAWKPLLPFRGTTMVEVVLEAIRTAGLRAVVVCGKRGDELEALLAGRPGVRTVRNPGWERGMVSSILVGLEACEGEAAFITHADLPLVLPGSYRILAAERERRLASGLPEVPLASAYRGRMGHPVLAGRAQAIRLCGEAGGGRLREAFLAAGMEAVETADPGALGDVDTPEDYRNLLAGAT